MQHSVIVIARDENTTAYGGRTVVRATNETTTTTTTSADVSTPAGNNNNSARRRRHNVLFGFPRRRRRRRPGAREFINHEVYGFTYNHCDNIRDRARRGALPETFRPVGKTARAWVELGARTQRREEADKLRAIIKRVKNIITRGDLADFAVVCARFGAFPVYARVSRPRRNDNNNKTRVCVRYHIAYTRACTRARVCVSRRAQRRECKNDKDRFLFSLASFRLHGVVPRGDGGETTDKTPSVKRLLVDCHVRTHFA